MTDSSKGVTRRNLSRAWFDSGWTAGGRRVVLPASKNLDRAAAGPPPPALPPSLKRVLFVDDEPKVLEGLQRMLYPLRSEWQMEFVSSGHEALQRLSQSSFDVLVTDVRMPVMSGIQLLAEVLQHHPQVIRLVLSGTVDQELTLQSAALAHQYLVKPCDAKTLRSKVDRALNLRVMLNDPGLKQVISRLRSLPSIPAVHLKLIQALQLPEISAKQIGEIVKKDIGMTAKVLQLANSALSGIRRHIATPAEAVVYLGVDAVRALVLSASVFSQFEPKDLPEFSIESLQDHSLRVGTLAREIVRTLGWPASVADDAYVGGLLHDAGKLVLAHNCPEQYREVLELMKQDLLPAREAEFEVFGTTHAEVGGYLLWLWGLPDAITEVAAMHHRLPEDAAQRNAPVVAVHIADALVNGRIDQDLDQPWLRAADLLDNLPDWLERSDQLGPDPS